MNERAWRSLDELADTPEFQELVAHEFPGLAEDLVDPATRRDFLKILGASLGMVGLAACRWPKELIVPFANRPADRVPGVPQQYATAMELGGAAVGLLVTSVDGRPIKIEGNPLHPGSLGSASAMAQASVLELYDPDRSRAPLRRESGQSFPASFDEFAAFASRHFAALRGGRGAGLAVLTESTSSPSLAALADRFRQEFPAAGWYEYEPLSRDNEREGTRSAFGLALRPILHLDQARVIVSLDADPLYHHPNAIRHARDFATGRRAENGAMSRLYVAESTLSLTGSMADHRLALPPAAIGGALLRLAAELTNFGVALPPPLRRVSAGAASAHPMIAAAARDLAANRGGGVVLVGEQQPAELHALAHALNAALGNAGTTVEYVTEPGPDRPSHLQAIRALTEAMAAGQVDTLLILGGNPVYDAPADLDFAAALGRVPTAIHLSPFDDETSHACRWHLPRAHPLESWGDARAFDGTLSVVQPLIEPLYGGKTAAEILALVLGDGSPSGYEITRRTLQGMTGAADFEALWRRTLNDGLLASSAWPAVEPRIDETGLARAASALAKADAPTGLQVVFTADAKVHDGRFANNAWLQELPDPLTKLVWDNAALVSPATARALGTGQGEVVALTVGGRQIEVPVYVLPGVAPGTLVLPLGYGREAAGKVGNGVGVNAYRLRASDGLGFATGATVNRTGEIAQLVTTQQHWAIDRVGLEATGRRIGELVREGTLAEYRRDPEFARKMGEEPRSLALFDELSYKGEHQWGMAIDLAACIGCNACMVACQAENNIAVVGKRQVARERSMHWIRVDRYFAGKPDTPKVLFQPVACQQCENAPCEQVCPVAATVHSDEGLNQQVYNRCVGTRYCSNNCPYKVRRFNFFNYFKDVAQVEKMAFNPEATVRGRGVMEKCTFCIQRIEAVKIAAKIERRPIRDGEIVPACAQTCPTQAITFGDLRDGASRVVGAQKDPRAYPILAELNTKPRNRYLARLRNPAPGAENA